MKKLIQSFLTIFMIVFTIGMGFSLISEQDVASYHGENEYEHTYAEGLLADQVMDRQTADSIEQDTNVNDEQTLLAENSFND